MTMPQASARAGLAAAQAALLRALVADGPIPDGFDSDLVRAQARALLDKRHRSIRRADVFVAQALGDRHRELFEEWARDNPPRSDSCVSSDAATFAVWLAKTGALHDPRRRGR